MSRSKTTRYCAARLLVLPASWVFWPFSFSDEWALLPGPTFSGGFIHHDILCLTESKHTGGAQGDLWCDGCVTVTVSPTIHHLFQVTVIEKHLENLKLLPIQHIKAIYIFENEHFPHTAQQIMKSTELSSYIISLKTSISFWRFMICQHISLDIPYK